VRARLRLAAVSSLLTRPLTDGIEHGLGSDGFELTFAPLADCERRLAVGDADLALLPPASYRALAIAHDLDLRVVPGLAIVAAGQSPTSVTAVEPSGIEPLEVAFGVTWDTVERWRRQSGLPYVYALWFGRATAAVDGEVARLLVQSLERGLAQLPASARAEAHGGAPAGYDDRSAHKARYGLGSQELSGLGAYFEHLRLAEKSPVVTRLRLFDFAYLPEKPQTVVWPRQKAQSAEPSLDVLLSDAAAGKRLSPAQGLRLYEEAPLLELGAAADERRRSLHPGNVVTYIIDRNVNYTNLCVTACKFCNFYRPVKSKDGYTLSREVLAQKFAETVAMGGIQILLQGGVNPNLPITYYEDLFRWTKANFPLALHALSPEEVNFIAGIERLTIRQVLERLVAAGLDSVPGGGAEILDDEIRHRISPLKCSTDIWMQVMREAHAIGLRTTATMVFGFGETPAHIVKHLERLRALQDQTSGFTAFICWPFQAEGTRLKLRDDTTATRYLRVFSLARLYLDNFPNLQASWPTMGPAIGQSALRFGGNDFGSAMIEENVVSQAGAVFKLSADDIERYLRAAGFTPRRRNMRYELLPLCESVDPKLETSARVPSPGARTTTGSTTGKVTGNVTGATLAIIGAEN
jgi:cyclic dehypoxanthinyl futalosine synthase